MNRLLSNVERDDPVTRLPQPLRSLLQRFSNTAFNCGQHDGHEGNYDVEGDFTYAQLHDQHVAVANEIVAALAPAELRLDIPDEAWKETGESLDAQPADRLNATVRVNGFLFHAEAWRVNGPVEGDVREQDVLVKTLKDDFAHLGQAFAASGPFAELEIRGEPYVVFIFPAED